MPDRTARPNWGAGVLAIARRATLCPGRPILLGQRSRNVRSPLTWGPLGGWAEPGEEPAETAAREFREEGGYAGPVELLPDSHWEHRLGVWPFFYFTFHTFVGLVDDQFPPDRVQQWEVAEARWVSLDEIDALPGPGLLSPSGVPGGIHPGLQAYLAQPHIRALVAGLCGGRGADT